MEGRQQPGTDQYLLEVKDARGCGGYERGKWTQGESGISLIWEQGDNVVKPLCRAPMDPSCLGKLWALGLPFFEST